MRITILFLILSTTFSCINNIPDKNPKIDITASVIKSYDLDRDSVKLKTYDIKLSIFNRSPYSISFWMWTCSWNLNFLINNNYMGFRGQICDSNAPWLKHLNSNDSLILVTTVSEFYADYHAVKSTRFGLIYIDSTKYDWSQDFFEILDDKSKYDHIIWSNPLYLGTLE